MCRVRRRQPIADWPGMPSYLKKPEEKKVKINFSGIPIYLKDQILKKMNYRTYGTYMMTGKEAGALSARNDTFTYAMPKYRMTIKEEKVSFVCGWCNFIEWIPFEMCSKMTMRPQIVEVQDRSISAKTCDFLLKLDEIHTFECLFPDGGVPHIADFFKKAKIQNLKMTLVKWVDYDFDYDTSRLENVEIVDTRLFFPDNIFSIKARRSLTLTSVGVYIEEIQRFITQIRNGAVKPDLILNNVKIFGDEIFGWSEMKDFLQENFTRKGKTTYVLNVGDEPRLKVDIESFTSPFNITFKVL